MKEVIPTHVVVGMVSLAKAMGHGWAKHASVYGYYRWAKAYNGLTPEIIELANAANTFVSDKPWHDGSERTFSLPLVKTDPKSPGKYRVLVSSRSKQPAIHFVLEYTESKLTRALGYFNIDEQTKLPKKTVIELKLDNLEDPQFEVSSDLEEVGLANCSPKLLGRIATIKKILADTVQSILDCYKRAKQENA